MAIKLVINGFFRSGTSIIWQILKLSNPQMLVFYEPSHKNLIKILKKYKSNYKNDKGFNMHGMKLWEEYFFKKDFIKIVQQYHPNKNIAVPNSYDKLREYIFQFSILHKDVVLQTNRWHDFFGNIKNESVRCLHIIRNPIDVYESLIRYSFSSLSTYKKIIKNSFPKYFYWKMFDVNFWYKHYKNDFDNLIIPQTPFEQFFIVWVISNYNAIRSLDVNEVLLYEDLINDPKNNTKYFKENNIEFDYRNQLRLRRIDNISDLYCNSDLKKLSQNLNISNQYQKIVNIIKLKNEV